MTVGAPKGLNNVTSTFFNSVHLLPKDLRFKYGGAKLASCPGCHLTSIRPWSVVPDDSCLGGCCPDTRRQHSRSADETHTGIFHSVKNEIFLPFSVKMKCFLFSAMFSTVYHLLAFNAPLS